MGKPTSSILSSCHRKRLYINGRLSFPFKVSKGVHQGSLRTPFHHHHGTLSSSPHNSDIADGPAIPHPLTSFPGATLEFERSGLATVVSLLLCSFRKWPKQSDNKCHSCSMACNLSPHSGEGVDPRLMPFIASSLLVVLGQKPSLWCHSQDLFWKENFYQKLALYWWERDERFLVAGTFPTIVKWVITNKVCCQYNRHQKTTNSYTGIWHHHKNFSKCS